MLAHVVAQPTTGQSGGFDIFNLLLPLALAFLIFTMFRRQRKAQQQVKDMRTQMEPGTEVMTQFGLFGTIVSIDQENNKAVLELSPGNFATVHTQALSKVVQQEPAVAAGDTDAAVVEPADRAGLDGVVAPDDASSIDGVDRGPAGGSSVAGTPGSPSGAETPEETLARLDREAQRENRDARNARDPKADPDN
ncbi:preprotein translocase subunit YajC [Arthrobacter sp. Ld5]|uniref:preprotein translocase subunit YajC n=1 Tax=Arthrobacter sp. Ld5 TaxID=649152 RepID=UPI003EB786A7